MGERVGVLGGAGRIESQSGRGIAVWARMPIGESNEDAEDKGTGGR